MAEHPVLAGLADTSIGTLVTATFAYSIIQSLAEGDREAVLVVVLCSVLIDHPRAAALDFTGLPKDPSRPDNVELGYGLAACDPRIRATHGNPSAAD